MLAFFEIPAQCAPSAVREILILFVGPQPPPVGGVAEALEHLATAPALRQYRTTIFNTSDGETSAPVGPKKLSLRAISRRIRLLYKVAMRALQLRPDILHYHFGSESFFNEIADFFLIYAGALTGARVVMHLHMSPAEAALPGKRSFGCNLFRILALPARATFVLTQADKEFLDHHGLAKNTRVLPNTCDERLVKIDRADADASRDSFRVAFLGRLTRAKGVFDLLDVSAAAKAADLPWTFEVAGLPASAGEQREIESIVAERRLTNINFHGVVRDAEKVRFFASAHVVFIPSHAESFGITAIEAMAAALPVVASKVGGLISVVVEGTTGMLVERSDVAGFFDALHRVADSHELQTRYGTAGRRRFMRLYSQEQVGAIAASLYRDVIKG